MGYAVWDLQKSAFRAPQRSGHPGPSALHIYVGSSHRDSHCGESPIGIVPDCVQGFPFLHIAESHDCAFQEGVVLSRVVLVHRMVFDNGDVGPDIKFLFVDAQDEDPGVAVSPAKGLLA